MIYNNLWFIIAFLATLTTSCQDLFTKYLIKDNYDIYRLIVTLLFFQIIAVFGVAIYFYIYKNQEITSLFLPLLEHKKKYMLLALLYGISFIFIVFAIKLSPNPGYVKAIVNLNAVIVSILAVYLLKSHLNRYTLCGVSLIVLGTYIVITYSNP